MLLNDSMRISPSRILYLALNTLLIFYVMWYAGTLAIERPQGAIIFLGISCAIIFVRLLIEGGNIFGLKRRLPNKALLFVFTVLSITFGVYFFVEYYNIMYYRMGVGNIYDLIFGTLALILVLVSCWKGVDKLLVILAVVFMVYALVGPYIPVPLLKHSGLSVPSLFRSLSSDIPLGIFGSLTQIAFTWIASLSILFSFISALGAKDSIFILAKYMANKSARLVPQTGVVLSGLFGMFSGAAVTNVIGTGSITIPMNKHIGMPTKFAAAIESVASSGGLILPPVLGYAAFLMASLLGVPYIYLVAISVIPAILYYLSTSIAVLCITGKYLNPRKAESFLKENPPISILEFVRKAVPLFFALAILIFLLAYYMLDPLIASFYTFIIYLPFAFIYNYLVIFKRSSDEGLKTYLKDLANRLYNAIENGGYLSAVIGVMLATLGIITGVLTVTGSVMKWSMSLTLSVGDNFVLLVLIAWLITMLLGFGLAPVAVYAIAIGVLAAPFGFFVKQGYLSDYIIPHFFVFWISTLSAITPPVAVACATASKIAQERFITVCWESIKIGLPLLLICFSFFTWQDLLVWSPTTLITTLILMICSVSIPIAIFSISSLEVNVHIKPLRYLIRILLGAFSLVIFLLKPLLPIYIIYGMVAIIGGISLTLIALEIKTFKR